ncbi:site-specific DNA-methyltransferase [bacterium]|nr:site-specific DNA-methyltransferase [bacterium]
MNISKIEKFKNKVIQGDCLEVLQNFPDNSIDMVLCDLPYGTTQNKWDSVIDLDKLWHQYRRIVKDNGAIVLTSQGLFTAKLILSNPKEFKYKIVWIKSKATNFLNAKKQPLRKHEDICVFYKNQTTYNPQMEQGLAYDKGFRKDQYTGSYGDFKPRHVKSNGDRYPTDIITFADDEQHDDFVYFKTAESEGKVFHPTQKPIELGRYLIRTFSNPGDYILDNACGSGSFLISAMIEGRNFIGIEKNEYALLHKKNKIDYIEICTNRIEETLKNNNYEQMNIDFFKDPISEYHVIR